MVRRQFAHAVTPGPEPCRSSTGGPSPVDVDVRRDARRRRWWSRAQAWSCVHCGRCMTSGLHGVGRPASATSTTRVWGCVDACSDRGRVRVGRAGRGVRGRRGGGFGGAARRRHRHLRVPDASVPPQYHRSVTLTVTREDAHIVIDSYGDVLADERVPTPPAVWDDPRRDPAGGRGPDGCRAGAGVHRRDRDRASPSPRRPGRWSTSTPSSAVDRTTPSRRRSTPGSHRPATCSRPPTCSRRRGSERPRLLVRRRALPGVRSWTRRASSAPRTATSARPPSRPSARRRPSRRCCPRRCGSSAAR